MTQPFAAPASSQPVDGPRKKRLALVASKGTLDQAYPPLILASTAVSLGWEAGIYFTFYGLDILHKDRFEHLKVASLANPSGPIQLPNILGAVPGATAAATKVMKKWMTDARMPSVPEFLDMTREMGVQFFACATTMGVMGVEEQDLIEGADIAGAAAFLDYASEADVSMFV
ncbi:MAG: DsrE/DsrF/DrsH-like family protein [Acidimicrobiia bacterium]|nr:DsrE/DsrF/DrsH-like family protein [Acidimicrobiia bacterium]MDH3462164.1 DsrE/DsrF/DrsH-like family protein [Acidimicrobiia bacterium]